MQIYKYMDIGTAKPTSEEMNNVPHHMINIISPADDYSVACYVEDASNCINKVLDSGKIPIVVGGTGLYVDSLLAGRKFMIRGDNALRKKLEDEYNNAGGESMINKLWKIDAASAAKLSANDKKRIVRAFEIYELTGKPVSLHDAETKTLPPQYDAVKIALTYNERSDLYARIDDRVDQMIQKGFEKEVRSLIKMGVSNKNTSMQAIGYKEISDVITGKYSLADAVVKIKMASRRYAKRQLTWFRRDKNIKWLTRDDSTGLEKILQTIMVYLNEKK